MKTFLSIISIAIVSSVHAARICSVDLGNFFNLPSWMPLEVSTSDTPGSDPFSGEEQDWYIDEYTNVVTYGSWKHFVNGKTEVNADNPSYADGGWSMENYSQNDFSELGYPVISADNLDTTPKTISDPSASLTRMDCVFSYDAKRTPSSEVVRVSIPLMVKREKYVNRVSSGRKVPRSPRLTSAMASAINSTFEAFFERQYYASEAQSNVWDITTWGPTMSHRRFKFDPFTDGYGWDYSTNRTIITRRLFGWDKIESLANFLVYEMYARCMPLMGPRRPGWIESCGDNVNGTRCFWSTKCGRAFDYDEGAEAIVPALDGTKDPFSKDVDWSRCSQTFKCLERDINLWDNNISLVYAQYGDYEEYREYPTSLMMNSLRFNDEEEQRYSITNCMPAKIPGITMGHLIETNFPHADGWAISNSTRRLFSEKLCCMNQMLSLMDRTYHVPTIDYPTTGTNFTFRNTYTVRGLAGIGLSYDEGTGEAHVLTTSPISWTYSDGHMTTSSCSVVSDGNAYHFRASGTSTSAVVTVDDPAEQYLLFGGVTDELINEIITKSGVGSTTGNVDIYVSPQLHPSGYRYTVFAYGMPDWYVSPPSGFIGGAFVSAPTNLECLVEMNYSCEYSYSRTTGRIGLGPTQPGWESYDRVVQNNYGLILGRHLRKGDNYTSLGCLPFSQYDSYCDWYSWQNTYFNRSGLIDLFPDRISDLLDYFQTQYGGDPENPEGTIEIGQDAWDVQNSVRVINPSATVGLSGVSQSRAIVSIGEGGQVTIIGRETWPDGTQYPSVPYFVDMFKISLTYEETHDSPGEDEKDPIALDARFGLITRTDWQWKALQRVDE